MDRQNSDIKKKNVTSLLTKLSMVLLAFYAGITLLNIVFNKKNVVWLKQNSFFVNSVVIPARYFEWMENDKALRKTVLYFSRRGDTKRLKEAQELRKKHWDTLEPSLKIHIPEI
ncbi:MAG: hypothetical protein NT033_03780 [Candidatus Omnitrophica bacterium]|nr:hypothetical protein [Candidatus Omnitrophota bacterium]